MSTPLSAVIITFNEERNIARCLESIKGVVEDIIVVDSGSSDRTVEICRSLGASVHIQSWLGYSDQKNFANAKAKFAWVLSLDADEALDDKLRQAILAWKERKNPTPAKFKRMTNYCGSFIRHGGWYPDIKVRIFNQTTTKWEGIIHEDLSGITENQVELLDGDCLHYSYYTVDQHRAQSDKFTTIAAADLFERGKKASWVKRFLSPVSKFVVDYFFRMGFLDGRAGFTIARLSAHATYAKYAKLHALNSKR
jgi:glycosyltransferase involved in cell wall biosynthesis